MSARSGMRKATKQGRQSVRRGQRRIIKSTPAGGGSKYAKKKGGGK